MSPPRKPKKQPPAAAEVKGAKPEMKPREAAKPGGAKPEMLPPAGATMLPVGGSRPAELPPSGGRMYGAFGAPSMPTEPPPAARLATGAAATWVNDKKVLGVWSINEMRNGCAYFSDVGWKRLANTSETAFQALNLLAAHALQTQSSVNFREEADGLVHEIYVW